MKVAFGCDHGGFPLKETVLDAVRAAGHEPIDLGTFSSDCVDFPDFVVKVGNAIQNGEAERGILCTPQFVTIHIPPSKVCGMTP
jgi:ribose 5-phosphate isomerase B